jgi:hypothetical protein
VYILVTGEMPLYTIRGWCYARELIHGDNLIDLGYGQTYALDQARLRTIEQGALFEEIINDTREPERKQNAERSDIHSKTIGISHINNTPQDNHGKIVDF